MYLNQSGHIRKVHEYNKLDDYMEHARRIDAKARELGVDVVQLDANGPGGGVFSNIETEFPDRPYLLVGLMGGRSSSDTSRWLAARSEHYDSFREAMQLGLIDLDPEDTDLRDQLFAQTYKIADRGQIQITPKKEMAKAGIHSPDHLDAAIYSYFQHPDVWGERYGEAGDVVSFDPAEIEFSIPMFGAGIPL